MTSRWRLVIHALDRTGPPVLARSFLRWLVVEHGDHTVDVVAFRGGELLDDFVRLSPVRVLLDPEEPWEWRRPDPDRISQLRARVRDLPPVDATLLISVAAGQALPFLPPNGAPIVTWVVEEGESYPYGVDSRTDRWLAGSEGTRLDVLDRIGRDVDVHVAPEFVEHPPHCSPALRQRCRTALGAVGNELLVLGAGIATIRKAPDLFLEVALAYRRAQNARPAGDGTRAPALRFVWLGGERDGLFHQVRDESVRLGLDNVRFFGSVVDVSPWLAASDMFLHPARLDSFPNVCLHAALAGTPVVAFSGAGGVPEMLGADFCGSPYPDVVGLAGRLEELTHPTSRAELAERQQRTVRQRYTAEVGAPVILEQMLAAVAAASPTAR